MRLVRLGVFQASKFRAGHRLSLWHVRRSVGAQPCSHLPNPGADLCAAGSHSAFYPIGKACCATPKAGAVFLWRDGRADAGRSRSRHGFHIFSVLGLSMDRTASIIWFLKASMVCALILEFCWITPRFLRNIPDFPAVTADGAQSDIADRYFKLPVADVALTESSFTTRLREEFFQKISVRNFALPGGSPLTGAAVIDAAAS